MSRLWIFPEGDLLMWAKYRLLNKSDLPKLIHLLEGTATSYKIEKDVLEPGIFLKVLKEQREDISYFLGEKGITTESIY